ncbi:MAG: hypothetical protein ACI9SC_000107 [Gammaproteobacteria bacterium]
MFDFTRKLSRQTGQSAVITNLFLLVIVIAGLSMYKSGKLTTDKMQLQNAADAAAYSMALTEARDLNFAAYMNRAIVANEVAIGQLVGLSSWAFHYRSFGEFLTSYDTLFIGPATLGVSTPIINTIASVFAATGEPAINILSKVANIGTTVLHNINKIYGLAEYGYHAVSVVFAIGVLNQVINDNAPPGTKLSDFGTVALIAHIFTYGGLPGLPGDQFSTAYNPTTKQTAEELTEGGYGRLAATIRDGRDPFTRGTGGEVLFGAGSKVSGKGWELRLPGFPIDVTSPDSFPFVLDAGVFGYEAKITFHFDLSLERKGGSELRLVLPSGNSGGESANWSAADTTGLFFELGGSIHFKVWVLPEPFRTTIFNAGGQVTLADSRLTLGVTLGDPVTETDDDCLAENDAQQLLNEDTDADGNLDTSNDADLLECTYTASDFTILDIPFPTAAPFGAGFSQAGFYKPGNALNNKFDKPKLLSSPLGPIEPEHYGEAANNLLAWESPGPVPPFPTGISSAPLFKPLSHVNKTYKGLPRYVDTTGNESFLGIGAPNLLIGLVLDENDFDQNASGNGVENEATGQFQLTEDLADQELAVIAKAELYFSRPSDFADTGGRHFWREDRQTEYGNGFNPYWQVRLVETTYADRVLALFIQQKQNFVDLGESFDAIFGDIMSYLPGAP